MPYAYANAEKTLIAELGRPPLMPRVIPADEGNADYAALVASGEAIGDFVPPPTPPRLLTFLDFIGLFTPAEQGSVFGSNDAQVRQFIAMAGSVPGLDLADERVANGVRYLASLNLITADRAGQILTGTAPPR